MLTLQPEPLSQGLHYETIDVRSLHGGQYVLKIKAGDSIQAMRLSITR